MDKALKQRLVTMNDPRMPEGPREPSRRLKRAGQRADPRMASGAPTDRAEPPLSDADIRQAIAGFESYLEQTVRNHDAECAEIRKLLDETRAAGDRIDRRVQQLERGLGVTPTLQTEPGPALSSRSTQVPASEPGDPTKTS